MHFSSPKMVCETKIVADEHDAIPGTKKESIMWSAPPSSAALSAAEAKDARRDAVFIREFERGDQEEVRRIFYEGIMERIPNTAFRGLRQQPKTQFLYALLTGKCLASCGFCQALRPTFFFSSSNHTENFITTLNMNYKGLVSVPTLRASALFSFYFPLLQIFAPCCDLLEELVFDPARI